MTVVRRGDVLHVPWMMEPPFDCDVYLVINDDLIVRIETSETSSLAFRSSDEHLVESASSMEFWVDVHFDHECDSLERQDRIRKLRFSNV